MKIDFTGRVAIVTGAAGGIGREVAIGLSAAGARVLVVDLAEEGGRETAAQINASGGSAIFVRADVSQAADVKNYADVARDTWGRIDVFMNNAGWQGVVQPVVNYPLDVFDKVMAINVRGVFLGLQHVLPTMIAQGSGAIVNTSSLGGYIGARDLAPYVASKHAVLGLTKSVAIEVARNGIRVNAVCPGPVDTAMLRDIESLQAPEHLERLRKKRASSIPDGRYATASEVANLMMYLASDYASHVTGQGMQINGGSHA